MGTQPQQPAQPGHEQTPGVQPAPPPPPQQQQQQPATQPGAVPVTDGRERRKSPRRVLLGKANLTVLDGPLAGGTYEVQTRDLSLSGLSFLLKEELKVGYACRIDVPNEGSFECEVVRSRPLSNGKYEIGVQIRRPLKP